MHTHKTTPERFLQILKIQHQPNSAHAPLYAYHTRGFTPRRKTITLSSDTSQTPYHRQQLTDVKHKEILWQGMNIALQCTYHSVVGCGLGGTWLNLLLVLRWKFLVHGWCLTGAGRWRLGAVVCGLRVCYSTNSWLAQSGSGWIRRLRLRVVVVVQRDRHEAHNRHFTCQAAQTRTREPKPQAVGAGGWLSFKISAEPMHMWVLLLPAAGGLALCACMHVHARGHCWQAKHLSLHVNRILTKVKRPISDCASQQRNNPYKTASVWQPLTGANYRLWHPDQLSQGAIRTYRMWPQYTAPKDTTDNTTQPDQFFLYISTHLEWLLN